MALALLKVTVAVPAGGVVPFAGAVAPSGYLLCDGSLVSRAVYPSLFAAIGTLYGAGDGTTTFAIPDTRGIFMRGAGTHGSALNGKVPVGVLATKEGDSTAKNGLNVGSHTHGLPSVPQWVSTTAGVTGPYVAGAGALRYGVAGAAGSDFTLATTSVAATPGLTGDTETRPANIGVNYIIKT